jgi:integrase
VIRQRGDGYQVRVYAGLDPLTGKERKVSRTAKTKREAERLERRLMTEAADGRHRGTTAKTMAELVDQWLDWRAGNGKDISPKTVNDYRSLIEKRIKPAMGRLPIGKLDVRTLDLFYDRLRKGGADGRPLSGSRVRDVHVILSGALGMAARYGWIPQSPAAVARPAAGESEQREVPTAAQVRELFDVLGDEPDFELFVRLSATTGLRPGEVCALRWCDLDPKAAELEVTGNIVRPRASPAGTRAVSPRASTASASWPSAGVPRRSWSGAGSRHAQPPPSWAGTWTRRRTSSLACRTALCRSVPTRCHDCSPSWSSGSDTSTRCTACATSWRPSSGRWQPPAPCVAAWGTAASP